MKPAEELRRDYDTHYAEWAFDKQQVTRPAISPFPPDGRNDDLTRLFPYVTIRAAAPPAAEE